jgi:MscS family membrane protein
MKDIMTYTFYHNSLEEWLTSVLIIFLSVLIARGAYWLLGTMLKKITQRTETQLDDLIIDKMERPAIMLIIIIGVRFALEGLHFTEGVDTFIHRSFIIVIALNVTWFVLRLVEAFIENFLVPYAKRDDNTLDDQMILLVERGIRVVLWTIGIIVALNNAGFDVGALIAGLGIGGLAVALAAQDTVKNIFGGIMIFIDKPFRIGDRVVIGEYDGFVEYIGIRSTRMRTLAGRQVTIPNAQFTDRPIENITIEPARRVDLIVGLTYDTPPEKMELAINILKDIAVTHPNVITEQTIVFFQTFNAFSLDIKFVYYIQKGNDIFETQTAINREILKRFNDNGLEFAFPTRTVYNKEG